MSNEEATSASEVPLAQLLQDAVPDARNLLEQARTQWQFGDWQSLALLDQGALERHPDRATLALLAAGGKLQIGQIAEAKQFIQLSREWGVSQEFVHQIVVAGIHNSLGRTAAIAGNESWALKHFQSSLRVEALGGDASLLTKARVDQQYSDLGMPPVNLESGAARDDGFSSKDYWEARYRDGNTSGSGSYGRLAEFKANVLNKFISDEGIQSVLEFGCGDGNQLAKLQTSSYLGVDVSETVISKCRSLFGEDSSKSFCTLAEFLRGPRRADLTLSLDVIYHLIEDEAFDAYMHRLFEYSRKYCVVYACNEPRRKADPPHVRRRLFSAWVEREKPEWKLVSIRFNDYPFAELQNGKTSSISDFYFYKKVGDSGIEI